MREDFLHFLWRQARFDLRNLKTTTGATISIQDFGRHNKDAGPDFLHGQLRLNGQQWAGNIELHVKSSDWYVHKHENDRAYDNVILHVVYEEDRPVFRANGERIPCLELRSRVPSGLLSNYWRMQNNEYWISCQHQLHQVDESSRREWLDQLIQQRMQKRAKRFSERMTNNHRDWEEAYYQSLARALGGRVNADAMDILARSLPLRVLLKHKHSLLQLEALLFGQSGLLPKVKQEEDDYLSLLRREYALLRLKHNLRPIPATAWRYLRLRPNNFPTVRIAQLAAMLHRTGQLFGKSLAAADARELQNMFVVKLSNYWREHYRFGKRGKAGERRLGAATIRSILINTIAPALIAYGDQRSDVRFRERAFSLLRELPAERNVVLEKWAALGMKAANAAESQALLELKIDYCEPRRCTSCAIGCRLLAKPYEKEGDEPLLTLNEQAQVYGMMGGRS
ncbi:DUF2851 family protein [Neolewinella persica]|uniref:DUF2851 family protein n=1 Tax=Neolewinella persica TaxID=70998 RepID=UPI0003640A2A|nr:DUF2851 family protein [Neolewinella persica]